MNCAILKCALKQPTRVAVLYIKRLSNRDGIVRMINIFTEELFILFLDQYVMQLIYVHVFHVDTKDWLCFQWSIVPLLRL